MTKQHRGGLFFTHPSDACTNSTAEMLPGHVSYPYSLGFRLARDGGEVESWGSAHCIEHPLLTYDLATPKDDYDHYVGFRLVWGDEISSNVREEDT